MCVAKNRNACHPFRWANEGNRSVHCCTRYDKFLLHIICKLDFFSCFAWLLLLGERGTTQRHCITAGWHFVSLIAVVVVRLI